MTHTTSHHRQHTAHCPHRSLLLGLLALDCPATFFPPLHRAFGRGSAALALTYVIGGSAVVMAALPVLQGIGARRRGGEGRA
ncbi:hypothetical protein [Streptomyces sp. T028]|uniref:hypothetical protein n=1 Tax=Streptomyces sp. T028 TaxID=3394379 RepID=UPI003A8B14E7